MKKPFVALLLLVGVAAMVTNLAFAQTDAQSDPGNKLINAKMNRELLNSRAQRLRVSAGPDPDTVWVGHSHTDHWSATTNYWNIYTGVNYGMTYGGAANVDNAVWDWDNTVGLSSHGVGDTLAGWWPFRRAYSIAGGLTLPDVSRPWWAIDIGNTANYVLNEGAGGKRTKGVVGVWHADPGNGAGQAVTWTPLSGSKSAWCGLRELNDNTVSDLVTSNPFNQSTIEFVGENASLVNPSNKRFPGYTGQWDQMLYRDLVPPAATPLAISFLYRTRMSTSADAAAATRTGWFHGDPLAVVAGNFISSTDAGANAPIDSFMVYVGVPVIDTTCLYSDGVTRRVYDKQRRWFSEVLRIFEGGTVPYYEIFSTSGNNPADTLSATPLASVTIPGANVDAIRNAPGNTAKIVRLVFRSKTNRGFDDNDSRALGYTSLSRGAVQIDDVKIGATNIGSFEGVEQGGTDNIDNRTSASATLNWKSTGKPPSIYFHARQLADLVYNDLCGPPDSPARFCDIYGTVIVAGNYDDGEKAGDSRFTSDREVQHGFWSPTINMVVDTSVANTRNPQGLRNSIVNVTDDYYIWYDIYAGMFNLQFTGEAWTFGAQAYPAIQTGNLAKVWGDINVFGFQIFEPEPKCEQDVEPLNGNLILGTTNSTGVPDSLRFFLGHNQQCFRFAVSLGCNSADGCYFDNVSLGFADLPPATQVSSSSSVTTGSVASDIWYFLNDAFPANESPGLPGLTVFDTTTALVKAGINNAPSTGNALRFDVPGDTILIKAANVTTSAGDTNSKGTRVDMVFRVLPGPGNYKIAGAARGFTPGPGGFPTGDLLALPNDQTTLAAAGAAGTASFWKAYMADPGQFSKGTHAGGVWNYLTWNSARCDTVERNAFPVTGKLGTGLTSGTYMNTLHEADPKFGTLGYNKFRCFMVDTLLAAAQTNIVCDGTVPGWLSIIPTNRTGYDGSNVTKEFTKIIPDGLLTPGAHVQYFFRKQQQFGVGNPSFDPDTTAIFPQVNEGGFDSHRWQQFGVLPDRWKGFPGGAGMACMLYVDNGDRRGDERVWVSVMDSVGGTASAKFGAHNGWHATGGRAAADYGVGAGDDATISIYNRNQQPGTTWDMYGVKASESLTTSASALGNRDANRASMGLLAGKEAKVGPTEEMLRAYYRVVALLTGDLNSGVLGPFANRSQNDMKLLQDFLSNGAGTAQPRGILTGGDGFMQSETQTGGVDPSHLTFLNVYLGLILRNGSYQSVSGNTNNCADLLLNTGVIAPALGGVSTFGVGNSCAWSNDLPKRNPSIAEATDASFYEPVGVNAPYTAAIYKPANVTRNWVALSEGWDIRHLWSQYCGSGYGRNIYYYDMLNSVFGSICTLTGTAGNTLDVPQNGHGAMFTNFMKVGNSVMRAGNAKIHFGLASSDRVKIKMYDVTGRQIRTLADRSFNAGEYDLSWDGTDDSGNQVARGVYFARIEYATKGTPINGRVVVLR